MILSYNDIMAMGFRIGTDIKEATVELAIEAAEMYYIAPSLEAGGYDVLATLDTDSALVKGGTYTDDDGVKHHIAGLLKGIGYIAYAELLRMNISATTFGSVQKSDEYSENVDPREQIRYFLAVGMQYVRQVCALAGLSWRAQTGVGRETYYTRKEDRSWQR